MHIATEEMMSYSCVISHCSFFDIEHTKNEIARARMKHSHRMNDDEIVGDRGTFAIFPLHFVLVSQMSFSSFFILYRWWSLVAHACQYIYFGISSYNIDLYTYKMSKH